MSMRFQAPRGTFDILPEDQKYWDFVRRKAEEICRLYGYRRIDTPVFEDARLFMRGVGEGTDIVEKEMYVFEDKGGQQLVLRPEGTAPICRAYIEHGMHNLPQPVKLYYFMSIFRYERPQAGRFRQHHQFGVEAIGGMDPALDAEVIEIAWRFFRGLGLKDLALLLNSIGCRNCRPEYVRRLREFYAERLGELCPDCRRRFERAPLRLLDCKDERCIKIGEEAPKSLDYLCGECRGHFEKLVRYLEILNIPFRIEHRLVRGLDYYTKTVFEIQPLSGGAQSALGGGGRYDDLIEELGGRPTPGVGFGAGIERVILNLKKQEVPIPSPSPPEIYIAYIGEEAKERALKLASSLREAGIKVATAWEERSIKGQFRQANSLDVKYTAIIGPEEVEGEVVSLRHMKEGWQRRIPLSQLLERPSEFLK